MVSALVELGSALHVLGSPQHHADQPWVSEVRSRMSPELTAETACWSWTTSAVRSRLFVREPGVDEGAESMPLSLGNRSPRSITDDLLRPLSVLGPERSLIDWAAARGPAVQQTVEQLVTDPAGSSQRFGDFLRATWEEWYADLWCQVRPQLRNRVRRFQQTRAKLGAAQALTSLHPAFGSGRDVGTVVLAKVQSNRHDVARRGLRVAPTVFGSPHVYVANVPGQAILLIHPLHRAATGPVPSVAELQRRLTVLANAGRLEVARAIAGEPRTAHEIASLWGMDATAVTRHLRALASSGLATSTRQGRYVRYQLNADVVQRLGRDLLDLLER